MAKSAIRPSVVSSGSNHNPRSAINAALLLAALPLLPGCGGGGAPSGRLSICTALFPLHDWAARVAGPDADVHLLQGGGDPHQFTPSAQDTVRVGQARALLAVGLGLDPWAERMAGAPSSGAKTELLQAGTWVKLRRMWAAHAEEGHEKEAHAEHDHGHAHSHGAGGDDPHVWLDPARAAQIVRRLGEEFARLDPAHADGYRRRAGEYAGELEAFSAKIPERAKPVSGKKLVTLHDGFGYLLERMGLELAGVAQVSPGVEPGARDVAEAIRAMKAAGQKVVFAEPGREPAARALAESLGGKIALLDPLETPASPTGTTYLERLEHDVNVLVENLK